jgi:hypothetical protein
LGRFGRAQEYPHHHQLNGVRSQSGHCLNHSPQQHHRADHATRTVAVRCPPSGDLEDCIGPKERTQHVPLLLRVQTKFIGDQRHTDRDADSVYIADRTDHEEQEENPPAPVESESGLRSVLSRNGAIEGIS